MWVIDEVTQIFSDMMLEANIHNIVVFTVITSSTVLSVVGVLRHLYTFLYRLRHVRRVRLRPASQVPKKKAIHDLSHHDVRFLTQLDQFVLRNHARYPVRQQSEACESQPKTSNACLSCQGVMWGSSLCQGGLCPLCCSRTGYHGCRLFREERVTFTCLALTSCGYEQIIDLSHCRLVRLPARMGFHHMNAVGLNASHNCLSDLPDHMALMRRLMNINLQHNLLTYIPSFLASMPILSEVDLRNNKFTTFPDVLLDLPLVKLLLDHNRIRALPHEIHRLQLLQLFSIGCNKLTSIPETLFNIKGLKVLNFRGNSGLTNLSRRVGNLIRLLRIDVSRCDLRFIPSTLSFCAKLRDCNFSHNRLRSLPCELFQCFRLQRLDVSYNRLSCLPATLSHKSGYLRLTATGNNFVTREDPSSRWVFLEGVNNQGKRQTLSLKFLSAVAASQCGLDTTTLPPSIQDDLVRLSSCFYCQMKSVTNSIRAIGFSEFHQCPEWLETAGHFPFLYTFCFDHIETCSEDTVEKCLDELTARLL